MIGSMHGGSTVNVDTVVIGGGQAGLAIGYHLRRQQRDIVILDAGQRVGDAWRLRWDSLHLFTPAKYDRLPGMPFPADRLSFPSKDEVADYLEAYAARFALPVTSGVRVDRLRREGDRFVSVAGNRRWESDNVVIATGGCQQRTVPGFATELGADVVQLHSSEYRRPAQLPPGPVLVVGVGNSGAEIARELARTHPVALAGTPSAEVPFHPSRMSARFVYPLVRVVGLHVLNRGNPLGRRLVPALAAKAAPLIGTKVSDLVAAGVRPVPRVSGVRDGLPELDGGRLISVASVIWCTGFRDDFDWVELGAFDEAGRPLQHRGVADTVPGLYFLGQEWLYAEASATFPGIGRDAAHLAGRLDAASRARTNRRETAVGVRAA